MALVQKEIKRITIRKKEEQTTTIYWPSSEVYWNTNIYSDTAPSDGIYNFSAEVSAVSWYYGCIGIIINWVTVETFRTDSTSYVSFTYQTTLNAWDSIVLYLYGEPNQNAWCRNVQIDTVAIDRTEKQIRPVSLPPRINSDLIAYYPLTEDFNDHKADYWISGATFNANPGSSATITTLSWVSQKVYSNQADSWNGSVWAENTWDMQTLNEHTIMFWSNRSSISGWDWYAMKRASWNGVLWIWYAQNKSSYVYRLSYASNYNPDGRELYYNTSFKTWWHHIAWTYDGATAKLYMDGNLVGTYNFNFTIYQGTNSWLWQICWWATQTYMSDVYIYKTPLDATSISDYYNATKSIYWIS